MTEHCFYCDDTIECLKDYANVGFIETEDSRMFRHGTCSSVMERHISDQHVPFQHVTTLQTDKESRAGHCMFCGGVVEEYVIGNNHYEFAHNKCCSEMERRVSENLCVVCGDEPVVTTKFKQCATCNNDTKYADYKI